MTWENTDVETCKATPVKMVIRKLVKVSDKSLAPFPFLKHKLVAAELPESAVDTPEGLVIHCVWQLLRQFIKMCSDGF